MATSPADVTSDMVVAEWQDVTLRINDWKESLDTIDGCLETLRVQAQCAPSPKKAAAIDSDIAELEGYKARLEKVIQDELQLKSRISPLAKVKGFLIAGEFVSYASAIGLGVYGFLEFAAAATAAATPIGWVIAAAVGVTVVVAGVCWGIYEGFRWLWRWSRKEKCKASYDNIRQCAEDNASRGYAVVQERTDAEKERVVQQATAKLKDLFAPANLNNDDKEIADLFSSDLFPATELSSLSSLSSDNDSDESPSPRWAPFNVADQVDLLSSDAFDKTLSKARSYQSSPGALDVIPTRDTNAF